MNDPLRRAFSCLQHRLARIMPNIETKALPEMEDDMSSIPPRVNTIEQGMHTLVHRVSVLEDTHKDTPHRLTVCELAVKDMPHIRKELREQHDMIRKGFTLTNGILLGAAAVWFLFQAGPQIMKFLGGH